MAVFEAVRWADARVVVGSNAAVYGETETLPVREDDPNTPVSPFGAAALAADHYTRVHADVYDLPAVTLRYVNVYGPNKPPTDVVGDPAASFWYAHRSRCRTVSAYTVLDCALVGSPTPVSSEITGTRWVHPSALPARTLPGVETAIEETVG